MRRLHAKKGWSQQKLALRLQLRGWSVSRDSPANLELQRPRVPDCELLFLARALGVGTEDLFPKGMALKELGPGFQSGDRLAVSPTRGEK